MALATADEARVVALENAVAALEEALKKADFSIRKSYDEKKAALEAE
jgi:hypothetical protein